MRWERLWSDLESQAAALDRDELAAEVHDRTLIEQSSVLLMDRVRASVGEHLRCEVAGGGQWRGVLLGVGSDWLALGRSDSSAHSTVIVASVAVRAVTGLLPRAVLLDSLGAVARRSTLAMLVRHLASAGDRVQLHRVDAGPVSGRVAVVGRDYLQISDDDGIGWSVPSAAVAALTIE